jgi:uncharacterized SAM-binding protein YcdF (DUF218 family)
MSVGEARTTPRLASAERPMDNSPAPASSSRSGRLIGPLAAAAGLVAFALTAGFFWFAAHVADEQIVLNRSADGIVALTGGAARITDAVELLAAGRGRRLLISGVNPTTHSSELSHLVPAYQRVFSCCVDLDYSAVNTIGNALETRRWVRQHGFHSLVVVTSNYHMPRAMVELAHQLPDVTLIAFPVVPEKRRGEPWWSSPATAKILVNEYLKYIVTVVRTRFDLVATEATGADEAHLAATA